MDDTGALPYAVTGETSIVAPKTANTPPTAARRVLPQRPTIDPLERILEAILS